MAIWRSCFWLQFGCAREVSLDGRGLILWRFSKGDPVLLSGLDSKSEPCQRFFRDGLYSSFVKILTDEAIGSWKAEIQVWDFLRIYTRTYNDEDFL